MKLGLGKSFKSVNQIKNVKYFIPKHSSELISLLFKKQFLVQTLFKVVKTFGQIFVKISIWALL